MKHIALASLALVFGLASCVESTSENPAEKSAPLSRPTPSSSAFSIDMIPVWSTPTMSRRMTFGALLDPANPRTLRVEERLSAFQWNPNYYDFSASFDIHDVGTRGANDYYVLGTDYRQGVLVHVIEHWQVTPKPSAIGSPPNYGTQRDLLYRDVALGQIDMIDVDPEGRFLVVTANSSGGASDIIQLSLPDMTPTVLATGVANLTAMYRLQHSSLGRIWVLHTPDMDYVTTMYDLANDGVFESVQTLDYSTWEPLLIHEGAPTPGDWFLE